MPTNCGRHLPSFPFRKGWLKVGQLRAAGPRRLSRCAHILEYSIDLIDFTVTRKHGFSHHLNKTKIS